VLIDSFWIFFNTSACTPPFGVCVLINSWASLTLLCINSSILRFSAIRWLIILFILLIVVLDRVVSMSISSISISIVSVVLAINNLWRPTMHLTSKCLVCNSVDNLNTTIKIKTATQEVEISLCDEHEETSPKQARELVSTKLAEYEELKKKMLEFGVSVGQETAPAPKPLIQKQTIVKRAPVVAQKPITVDTTIDDSLAGEVIRQEQSINTEAEITNAIKKKDPSKEVRIPKVVEAESQVIRRGGGQISVPKKIRTDDGGVTNITIVETSNEDLQKRAKQMDPTTNPNAHSFKDGYSMKECLLCRSAGTLKNGQTCPKCRGSGYRS